MHSVSFNISIKPRIKLIKENLPVVECFVDIEVAVVFDRGTEVALEAASAGIAIAAAIVVAAIVVAVIVVAVIAAAVIAVAVIVASVETAVWPVAVAVIGSVEWRGARCQSVYPVGWSSFCNIWLPSSELLFCDSLCSDNYLVLAK